MENLLECYVTKLKNIGGEYLKSVILYGSYARGDYTKEPDIDIMILLKLEDTQIKDYRHQLSDITYDFNMENYIDIKPIAKNSEHFAKWVENYPFYANVDKEGVKLFESA